MRPAGARCRVDDARQRGSDHPLRGRAVLSSAADAAVAGRDHGLLGPAACGLPFRGGQPSRSEEVSYLLNRSGGWRPQALPSPGRERGAIVEGNSNTQ
jgi:hypothetical protein